jgi:hypothetical protein
MVFGSTWLKIFLITTDSPVLNVTVTTIKILPILPIPRLPVVLLEIEYSPHPEDPREIANGLELLATVESE